MSANEETPLIQVVHVAPPRSRYSHHYVRRFCTAVLIAIPMLTIIIFFLSLVLSGQSDLFGDHGETDEVTTSAIQPPHAAWPSSDGLAYSKLKEILQQTPDPEKARKWSTYYTAGPHLAGKNLSQAEWTRGKWEEWGVKSEIIAYETYINYPLDHSLALLKDGKVTFQATLEEDVLEEDPTTGLPDRIPTFHGYSASGNVTAQYVYCNYGTYRDFEELQHAGIELEGKIALVKYGGIFRGLKVKRASDLGMVGVVIYSDPGDDPTTEEQGYKPYPEGPARNPSSVQRGSVQYLSVAPGDPTTPGYPSKPGVPRGPANISTPTIPSLPISYAEALPLLQALNGHGPNASSFSERWHGGGLGYKNVSYNIGPSPASTTIHMMNEQEYTITPMWNVIGVINGTISDEVLVIGNHRDAWIAGGAADPNSGSAAMNEVIRSISVALSKGWKPQRTIVFASWDGEEYGLVGSTEWVEEYLPWLAHSAVAYINVDVGAVDTELKVAAAPLLDSALIATTKAVQSPNQTTAGSSVYDHWNKRISTMGSGSDFTAFQDYAGIPSIDLGFNGRNSGPVYHYHSNYDSQAWMDKYGDATFEYHVAIAKILSLLLVDLVEAPLIPFNATNYALALSRYLDSVHNTTVLSTSTTPLAPSTMSSALAGLRTALERLHTAAVALDKRAAHLALLARSQPPRTPSATSKLYAQVRDVNDRYKRLERAFLFQKGLDGRPWFKHVVFAPGLWTGYAGATWPGLVEAAEAGDHAGFERWAGICEGAVFAAVGVLEG
ncbi:hypothetical protein MBLNU457_7775t2 [Dothideomycetes sp. NU457]